MRSADRTLSRFYERLGMRMLPPDGFIFEEPRFASGLTAARHLADS